MEKPLSGADGGAVLGQYEVPAPELVPGRNINSGGSIDLRHTAIILLTAAKKQSGCPSPKNRGRRDWADCGKVRCNWELIAKQAICKDGNRSNSLRIAIVENR